jgi:hypothetical protein
MSNAFHPGPFSSTPTQPTPSNDQKVTFPSGAKRDASKNVAPFHYLPYTSLELASIVLHSGALRYGANNWKKGFPTEDVLNHALQHIYKWLEGDREEGGHLVHALCNLLFAAHFEYDDLRPRCIEELQCVQSTVNSNSEE